MLQMAASAAFTYLVLHPEDTAMLANLKHYYTIPGVDPEEVVDIEAQVDFPSFL